MPVDRETNFLEGRNSLIFLHSARDNVAEFKIDLPWRVGVVQAQHLGSGQPGACPFGVHPVPNRGEELVIEGGKIAKLGAADRGNPWIAGAHRKRLFPHKIELLTASPIRLLGRTQWRGKQRNRKKRDPSC